MGMCDKHTLKRFHPVFQTLNHYDGEGVSKHSSFTKWVELDMNYLTLWDVKHGAN